VRDATTFAADKRMMAHDQMLDEPEEQEMQISAGSAVDST
jgi:hypothetical protein